jgi:hypothetical protein
LACSGVIGGAARGVAVDAPDGPPGQRAVLLAFVWMGVNVVDAWAFIFSTVADVGHMAIVGCLPGKTFLPGAGE